MTAPRARVAELSATFRAFAVEQAAGISPLYACLAEAVADAPRLLGLADTARREQPRPNMLFAAVRYVLRRHPDDPLAHFYDGAHRTPAQLAGAFEAFTAFCQRWRPQIAELLATRAVQTNEVRRTSLLLPAFAALQRRSDAVIRVIDVGSSAGLTLPWPRYRYLYGTTEVTFPSSTSLQLPCEPRGQLPLLDDLNPGRFVEPIGLDIDPVDLSDPDTIRWLEALCWPEQTERRRLLHAAIEVAREHPPRLIGADATEVLPEIVADVPRDEVVCVVFCWSIYQIYGSPGGRERLIAQLAGISYERPVFEVSIGHFGRPVSSLILAQHHSGTHHERVAATCGAHGQWIDWHAPGGFPCP